MNNINGKTLQELLSNEKISLPHLNLDIDVENNFFHKKNSSLELANSVTDNLSANLIFLSLLLGDKIKI